MAEQSKTVDTALTSSAWSPTGKRRPRPRSPATWRSRARRSGACWSPSSRTDWRGARRTAGWRAWPLALAPVSSPSFGCWPGSSLDALAERFGETAVLSVRDGDEAVAVDQVIGRAGVLQVNYRTGTRHLLTVAASGRALLDPGAGVMVSEGELEPGVRGAAAVVGTGDQPIASLAVVAPAHRPARRRGGRRARAAARRIGDGLVENGLARPGATRRGRRAVLPTRR